MQIVAKGIFCFDQRNVDGPMIIPLLVFLLAIPLSGFAQTPAQPRFDGKTLTLTAGQSTGGTLSKSSNGAVWGVMLDKSCVGNFKKPEDACIEWKPAEPLPAGWWHGVIQSDYPPERWANWELSVSLGSKQNPSVLLRKNAANPQQFEFWIYTSGPAENVRLTPQGISWRFNATWPVAQITLEHREPASLSEADGVTLELPVQPDGSIPLPRRLPPGNWMVTVPTKSELTVAVQDERGGKIEAAVLADRWKRLLPQSAYFFLDAPLDTLALSPAAGIGGAVLRHRMPDAKPLDLSPAAVAITVDPTRTETGRLELIGSGLTGDAPVFPLLPRGLKTAVVTTWDDGKPEDLRCAEVFARHGYHPTFFMNQNSPAMAWLEKLEALGAEIGSHCYNHPSLYQIPPANAAAECLEMRKLLEKTLGHPVISFAYPFGYSPASDTRGDYVLRAVQAAGYWSGRTTATKEETVESYQNLLAMSTNGFFGYAKELTAAWEKIRANEGSVFYFWGHSWQIGKTDEQWAKFEEFVAQFGNQPDAWYATQGELSLWIWARKNVKLDVASRAPGKVVVNLSRPWLHPYLSAKCPLSLKIPAGVTKVLWQGKEVPIQNGLISLGWENQK